MKNHQVGILALLMLSLLATNAFATLEKGGKNGCYQINSAEDLKEFTGNSDYSNSSNCFELTADITLNENLLAADGTLIPEDPENPYDVWVPIGGSDYDFKGTFDGAGHTISGLYVNNPEKMYVGLFGSVDGATIKNVGVVNSYFSGKEYVGGLIGAAEDVTISNSYNTGTVSATGDDAEVGGLVGYADEVTISNSYNTGSVSATGKGAKVGGLIGDATRLTISNCYNTGTVSATVKYTAYVGGLIGVGGSLVISNCYNAGFSTNDAIINCSYFGSEDTLNNIFYLEGATTRFKNKAGIISASATEFGNGTVALKLRNYIGDESNGLVWGQTTIGDGSHPDLNGKLNLDGLKTITLVVNDSVIHKQYYRSNETFTLPNNIGKDNKFNGVWFNDEKLTQKVTSETITATSDQTFYAKALTVKIPSTDEFGCLQISDASELYGFAKLVNNGVDVKCATLTKDIVVNEDKVTSESTGLYPWEPIGGINEEFEGTFDGAGHTISGLYVNEPDKNYVGLFGDVDGATIKNVGIVNSYFNGADYVGSLAGNTAKSIISNSYNTGSVSGTDENAYVGGLVGKSYGGSISNCYNVGSSTGDAIVGENEYGYLTLNNVFYLENAITQFKEGEDAVSAMVAEFGNGTVALKLHNYMGNEGNGSIWGQEKSGDGAVPDFSGKLNVDGFKTITLVANDSVIHKQYYKAGESFSLPKDIDEYFAFTGEWFSDAELKNKVTSETIEVAKDLTFYAKAITPKIPDTDVKGCLQISEASELYGFAKLVNEGKNVKCAVLTKNIVVNEGKVTSESSGLYPWKPIGTYPYYFKGTFDGANHTISGLYVNESKKSEVGLFGGVKNGTIKNVGVANSYFNAADYVGGLVGYAEDVTISNSYNVGSVNATYEDASVGGLVGYAEDATISNSYNAGSVSATDEDASVGGLVGYAEDVTISNSYNAGSVSATDEDADVGGLVGYGAGVTISNSYNAGSVSGTEEGAHIGGLVGYGTDVTISNSYNVGSSVGDAIVGYKGEDGVTLNNVFYLATATTQFKDDEGAISATATQFGDGTVEKKLHDYKDEAGGVDGTIWGQSEYGDGKYPDHSGIKNMKFAISYYDENGEFIKTQNILYGEIPAFGDGAPAKESTAQYSYKLVWSPELKAVTCDADYTATFKEVPRTYKVTLNVSGGTLASKLESYTYGTGATLPTATRKGYTFEGWFTNAKFSGTKQTAIGKDATGDKEFFAKWGKDAEVVDGSSSSSAKPAGSSDSKPNVIASVAKQSTAVRLSVAGRNVQIAGARMGSAYAVLDLQGRVMQRGTVNHANFAIAMPHTGSFLVRIGSYVQQVNMR